MTQEQTLSIIKPDATRRNITGAINKKFEDAGLRIIAQKEFYLPVSRQKNFMMFIKKDLFMENYAIL